MTNQLKKPRMCDEAILRQKIFNAYTNKKIYTEFLSDGCCEDHYAIELGLKIAESNKEIKRLQKQLDNLEKE